MNFIPNIVMDQKVFTKNGTIILGSTFLKAFSAEDDDEVLCPKKLHAIFITGEEKSLQTESMYRGHYFEMKCLGVRNWKEIDLPRLKNGKKSAAHQRIDQQIESFVQFCNDYNIKIEGTDRILSHKLSDHIVLQTQQDFYGTMNGEPYVFDLKLTGDVNNTWGKFSWGEPSKMDHTQAFLNSWLCEQNDDPRKFAYLVFDYSPRMGKKVITKTVRSTDYSELENKINFVLRSILVYEDEGWPAQPSYEQCKSCPLKNKCHSANIVKPIEEI